MKKQRPYWGILFGLLLAAYTTYVMMDVFVIQRPMQENATAMNLSLFDAEMLTPTCTPSVAPTVAPTKAPDATPTPTLTPIPTPTPTPSYFSREVIARDDFYSNDHLNIVMTEIREHQTQVHIAEIRVSSARYLLTAFAKDTYGRNIFKKPTNITKDKDAVFVINGDNYGAQETGYVIRNGILYRESGHNRKEVMCIMPNGDLYFTHAKQESAKELMSKGVWQSFSFGPVLINNGEIVIRTDAEVDLCYATNPRTAIGMVEPLHYYIIVADGRTKESHGLSLYEMADIFLRLGCTKAYNLDGGGSSTMLFQGKIVNFPTGDGTFYEREVSDVLYLR